MDRLQRSIFFTILRIAILSTLLFLAFIFGAEREITFWLVVEVIVIAGVLDLIIPYKLPLMQSQG